MQPIDLLVLPRWLVPIQPSGVVLEEHALAVDGGRIVDVLPAAFARQAFQPRETLELPDHALMPGLVNIHTHSAMALLRGLADDLPLMDWLQNHIWPAEGANVSYAFCADGVRLAAAEMIRGGTTCFNDMYFFADATAAVAAEVGLRANVGLIVLDFPTAWAQNWEEYIHRGLEVHDRLRGDPLVRAVFAPHAPYTVSDAPLKRIRELATELGIGIHMHVHETAAEVEGGLQAAGKRPWQRLRELDLPGQGFIAVHMTQLTDAEIAEAARLGVSVAHCPESNLKLASGFCPVAKLLAAGVNVALGTDGAASNNDLDMFGELRTAALLAKGVAGDASALPAASALHMATLAGARALGLEDRIGSLEKGKAADFIAVNLNRPATQPVYNVLSQLVYAAGRDQVSDVYVAGRPLLRDCKLLTLNEAGTLAKAAEWRTKIAGGEKREA
ncbi:TRZ/ATZ family hydrolase [Nevskia soli]|uniref:TRZ/ATZ family hydrolase n=1 Tax=Nevskia soli TaxID=418856 RepID=UPI0004A73422|nr:TRZ/ATZ family hydrolase [Nevskia soli]